MSGDGICPHCGVMQRSDCLQGYVGTSDEHCPNVLINWRIAASLRAAGLLGDEADGSQTPSTLQNTPFEE